FLLPAQGRGCEEFDGVCCINLSDHSRTIHAQLQKLPKLANQLQVSSEFGFRDWLKSL
ncbi:hypothetical protein N339_12263, partial [Pterocles gutturalis]